MTPSVRKRDSLSARYEFKYVVDTGSLPSLREQLGNVMEPDPHAKDGGYHVTSLYFDSDDAAAYFEKLDGIDHRYKIRLRYYGQRLTRDDGPMPALFLEAKHRHDALIHKNRIAVAPERFRQLTEGLLLSLNLHEIGDDVDPDDAAILQYLINRRPLQPMATVTYHRQPLVCRIDPTLRITIDTSVRASGPAAFDGVDNANQILPPDLAILEIKFHWAMPLWLLEVCRHHHLDLRRYSKYCTAVESLYPYLARRNLRRQEARY